MQTFAIHRIPLIFWTLSLCLKQYCWMAWCCFRFGVEHSFPLDINNFIIQARTCEFSSKDVENMNIKHGTMGNPKPYYRHTKNVYGRTKRSSVLFMWVPGTNGWNNFASIIHKCRVKTFNLLLSLAFFFIRIEFSMWKYLVTCATRMPTMKLTVLFFSINRKWTKSKF